MTILWDNISAELQILQDEGNLVIPYNHLPEIDFEIEVNKEWWDGIVWNPPDGSLFTEVDGSASAKPGWDYLIDSIAQRRLNDARSNVLVFLRAECRRRISKIYGASNTTREIFYRLRAGNLPKEDKERDRLRSIYAQLKVRVKGMSYEELIAFDAAVDSHWASALPKEE